MGDLVKTSHSEINATLELLDSLGVTGQDFATLRKSVSWKQLVVANVHKGDEFLWALLEMAQTAKKVGFATGDFLMLSKSEEKLRGILSLIHDATIAPVVDIIDLDADPFVPDGWKVEKHCKAGQWKWEIEKVMLYLSERQKEGKSIEGNKLRKELEKMLALNANVLDYLLKPENQHLIPEEWKGKAVFFWGTIYRRSDGYLYVRYLNWGGEQWNWYYYWLDNDFSGSDPAALLAS